MSARPVHALVCETLGDPSVLRHREWSVSDPEPGQVAVEVVAAGVNFPDGLMVAGRYQVRPELPFVPGSEVAGRVGAVGAGVSGLAVGQRVAAYCALGGYAERVVVPAERVHPIGDHIGYAEAAILPVAFGTSYHGLVDLAALAEGEWLLVLGASGGTGLAAVQIGRALGARVIAAASTAEKLALCTEHGASAVVNYREEDLGAALRELTGDAGVDVVYDPVGGAVAQTALRRLAWRGRYLTVGYASGQVPEVGMNRLLLKEGQLLGTLWGAWARREPGRNDANMRQLLAWHAQGLVRPYVERAVALSDGAAALEAVMDRRQLGKVVLRMDEEVRRR